METPLLQTKLYIPPVRPELVSRPRLIEQLNAGLHRKLTLISAPAGFGKTTLLSEWVAGCGRPVAWVSLDDGDNDPVRFFTYLVAALQTLDPNLGQAARGLLGSPQPPPLEALVATLINNIATTSTPLVLVLDDYHTIVELTIHEALGLLLERQPPQMHVVLMTRQDPLLPLSRLRAQGQMTELRASDLQFTDEEAAAFLNQTMGLNLTPGEISMLETRTEGWIAGLQLAALSLAGQADHSAFVQAFSGDDRHVMDYLVDEVLSRQSEPVQRFLLRTSILNRLSGPLCDAVIDSPLLAGEGQGEGEGEGSGQATLEYLERANLFIVPLDNRRRWYRYHHLFADLLRARLRQAPPFIPPASGGERGGVATLHARASEWFERNGLAAEAVNHALAARDYERAARLVERNTVDLFPRGELHTLLNWVKVLPEELARSRPWLCIYQAWALTFAGQLDGVESLLRNAERHIQPGDPTTETPVLSPSTSLGINSAEGQDMLGNIAAMRAYVAVVTGDFSHAIELANLASETLSESSLWAYSVFQWALGYAHRMRGDLTSAGQAFAQVVRLGRAMDNVWTTVTGMTDLAMVHRVRGQLRQAADLYREALQLATERGARNLGYIGRVEAGLAGVLYEQNDLAAARRYATDSIEKTQGWKNPNHFVFSYNVLARVLQAQGDFQGALETLQQADQVRRKFPVVPALTSMIDKSRVRLWLAQGNTATVERWAQENRVGESETFDKSPEEEELLLVTLARVLIAQRKVDEALRLLNRLGENAEARGRIGILIEILVLQAMALQAKGDNVYALSVLEKGLALTEPEGYVRVFVDEGAPMAELLRQAASRGVAPGYVSKLLAAFPVSSVRGPSPLVEPLTKRELEVLRLVAQGASNRAIAESLVVTTGTIKTHVSRIMGKLGARNRTEAVARARELDML